jgi:hypothetical protein
VDPPAPPVVPQPRPIVEEPPKPAQPQTKKIVIWHGTKEQEYVRPIEEIKFR